jgi:hypothetical protein
VSRKSAPNLCLFPCPYLRRTTRATESTLRCRAQPALARLIRVCRRRTGASRHSPRWARAGLVSVMEAQEGLIDAPRPGAHDLRRGRRGHRGRDGGDHTQGRPRTGRPGRWPSTGSADGPSARSGVPSGSSPGDQTSSRSRRSGPDRENPTWSACTCPHGSRPRSTPSTRSRRSKRSTGSHRSCRCCPPPCRRPPTTTSATAPWTRLPPSRSPRARSSPTTQVPHRCGLHRILELRSTARSPTTSTYTSSSTTSPPTRPRPCANGYCASPGSTSSSPHLRVVDESRRAMFSALTTKKLQRSAHRSLQPLAQDPRLGRDLERQPPTRHVAQERRGDPRPTRRLLTAPSTNGERSNLTGQ